MNTFVDDDQVVGETEATLFEMLQQGPVDALVLLSNQGENTINYRFSEWNGTAWADLGVVGTDYYNTLIAGQVRSMKITSTYPRVRCVGNASGGSLLQFAATRFFNRTSGGSIPLMAF